jgi:hypothetical protein
MSGWVNDMISDKHRRVAHLLIISLQTNYNSSSRKIKSNEIIAKLRDREISIGDAELREIIGFIRKNDLCAPGFILSDNGGYWFSTDEAEMQRVWESNHGRALEIMTNFAPLHKRFKHLISEKNSLFNFLQHG